MRLIIAEKPSLARAIAAALSGSAERVGHHLQCALGDVIAWCAGHVLELAPPEDYSAALKAWSLETLPILPSTWRHRVTARELVDSLRRLLAKASRVVHAGDPDREGKLLVDEVLVHLGWGGPTARLLINDLSSAAVQRALAALEPNERFQPLYEEALARQRADWLYGINLTRLHTVRGRLSGYRGVVSVGRVQTPVLGLIVGRDQARRFLGSVTAQLRENVERGKAAGAAPLPVDTDPPRGGRSRTGRSRNGPRRPTCASATARVSPRATGGAL
jgi:DNA topoisomerase III